MNIKKLEKNVQNQLDRQALEGATSGWMEENVIQEIYNGGNEIKLPKMLLQGLGSYSRDDGYAGGAITFMPTRHLRSPRKEADVSVSTLTLLMIAVSDSLRQMP